MGLEDGQKLSGTSRCHPGLSRSDSALSSPGSAPPDGAWCSQQIEQSSSSSGPRGGLGLPAVPRRTQVRFSTSPTVTSFWSDEAPCVLGWNSLHVGPILGCSHPVSILKPGSNVGGRIQPYPRKIMAVSQNCHPHHLVCVIVQRVQSVRLKTKIQSRDGSWSKDPAGGDEIKASVPAFAHCPYPPVDGRDSSRGCLDVASTVLPLTIS
jgi:hypothetical protein